MLVTFIQGVIGTFDKHARPFKDRRGQKTGERAEDHLLEKSGVHVDLSSTRGAMGTSSKSQTPNPQGSSKLSIPTRSALCTRLFGYWDLGFPWGLAPGVLQRHQNPHCP